MKFSHLEVACVLVPYVHKNVKLQMFLRLRGKAHVLHVPSGSEIMHYCTTLHIINVGSDTRLLRPSETDDVIGTVGSQWEWWRSERIQNLNYTIKLTHFVQFPNTELPMNIWTPLAPLLKNRQRDEEWKRIRFAHRYMTAVETTVKLSLSFILHIPL